MTIKHLTLDGRFYLFGNPEPKEHTHIPGYKVAPLLKEISGIIALQVGELLEGKEIQQIVYGFGRADIYVGPKKNHGEEKFTLYEAGQYDGQFGKPQKQEN